MANNAVEQKKRQEIHDQFIRFQQELDAFKEKQEKEFQLIQDQLNAMKESCVKLQERKKQERLRAKAKLAKEAALECCTNENNRAKTQAESLLTIKKIKGVRAFFQAWEDMLEERKTTEQQSKSMLQQGKVPLTEGMARRQQQRQAAAKKKSQDATMMLPKPPLFSSAAHQKQWRQHKKSQPKATDELNLPDVVDSEGKHQQKASAHEPDIAANVHEGKKQEWKSMTEQQGKFLLQQEKAPFINGLARRESCVKLQESKKQERLRVKTKLAKETALECCTNEENRAKSQAERLLMIKKTKGVRAFFQAWGDMLAERKTTEQQSKSMLQQEKVPLTEGMARRQQQRQAAAKKKSQDATMTLPKPPLFSSGAHQKQMAAT